MPREKRPQLSNEEVVAQVNRLRADTAEFKAFDDLEFDPASDFVFDEPSGFDVSLLNEALQERADETRRSRGARLYEARTLAKTMVDDVGVIRDVFGIDGSKLDDPTLSPVGGVRFEQCFDGLMGELCELCVGYRDVPGGWVNAAGEVMHLVDDVSLGLQQESVREYMAECRNVQGICDGSARGAACKKVGQSIDVMLGQYAGILSGRDSSPVDAVGVAMNASDGMGDPFEVIEREVLECLRMSDRKSWQKNAVVRLSGPDWMGGIEAVQSSMGHTRDYFRHLSRESENLRSRGVDMLLDMPGDMMGMRAASALSDVVREEWDLATDRDRKVLMETLSRGFPDVRSRSFGKDTLTRAALESALPEDVFEALSKRAYSAVYGGYRKGQRLSSFLHGAPSSASRDDGHGFC